MTAEQEPQIESKEKKSERNLLTSYNATISAIAEVEGGGWLHTDQRLKDYHSQGALEHIGRLKKENPSGEDNDSDRIVYTIYGDGGMSRWYVTLSGEVLFSKSHNSKKVAKAEELGFRIFK